MEQLASFDLFEAVETTGDVATFESFFEQPLALEAALALEARVTDDAILWADTSIVQGPHGDAWVFNHHGGVPSVFQFAIQNHQYAVVQWLLTSPVMAALQRTTQLFLLESATTAIRANDPSVLELVLSSSAFAAYPDTARPHLLSTLLRHATTHSVLSVLLAHGADVNRSIHQGTSPLSDAACKDANATFVHRLIREGVFTVGHISALHRAAEYGATACIAVLVEHGVDPRPLDSTLETPLHRAATEGFYETVDLLCRTVCIDIDARNNEGDTALNCAVKENPFFDDEDQEFDDDEDQEPAFHPNVVDVLMRHGADSAIASNGMFKRTPLHFAVTMERKEVARRLLRHDADPNLPSVDGGQTPLHFVTRDEELTEKSFEILDLLVEYGADLTVTNDEGESPEGMLTKTEDGAAWLVTLRAKQLISTTR